MGLRISTVLKALLFHGQMAAWLLALVTTVAGRLEWAAAAAAVALGAHMAGRLWSRQSPVPMPYFMRWILLVPRGPHSPTRLRRVLQPRNGERILEIGPGVGVHAVSIAAALRPDGVLDVLDVQREMLDDLVRRAARAGLTNIVARQGDAQELPYPDSTFDAAYLISVLGEVPDAPLALRELRRVLKPAARLISARSSSILISFRSRSCGRWLETRASPSSVTSAHASRTALSSGPLKWAGPEPPAKK